MKLHWQIFIALVAGATAGYVLPHSVPYYDWVGTLFINALCMLIVPIMFFSITNSLIGVQRSGDGSLRRLGLKTFLLYVITMIIAIVTGLVLVNWINPGGNIQVSTPAELPFNAENVPVRTIITDFIPKNIFAAFAQNNTIPVIVVAFLCGITIPKISEKGRTVLSDFIESGLELVLKLTTIVIRFSPIGIFAIVAHQFALVGNVWSLIHTMLLYVLTVTAGLFIHAFVWLPLMLRFYKVRPFRHLKNMITPLLTAFSTASSGATLPLTLHAVEHKDAVSPRVTNFTVPLGAAINMNGTALLECVAVIFIAQAYGIHLSIVQQIVVAFVSLLCAIGSAAVPMAALVMMALILNVVGLPLEGIGLVIGVDRILDMMRTAVNVYGDTCVAVMVAKSEGETLTVDV
ncbi:MAG: dicarboxylate/amino acid:cation symporter [Bacteroidales bacterium]|nr:dicarboxylate/amino acid:cation symporter [Bacteroidales bacterium]